jgi:hypothetical protein
MGRFYTNKIGADFIPTKLVQNHKYLIVVSSIIISTSGDFTPLAKSWSIASMKGFTHANFSDIAYVCTYAICKGRFYTSCHYSC